MSQPNLLGIAVPSYKRPEMLARLLDSIDADHVPVTVSDNGSFLDEGFRARYPRVRFIACHPAVGMWQNWNRAARAVDCEWIIEPGDDDLYYPGAIDRIEQAIRDHPEADILFFGHHLIDEHDRVIKTWRPEAAVCPAPDGFVRMKLGVSARPPGIAFRKSVFDRLGGFWEEFKSTASDNDLYQRIALLGTAVLVPNVVCGYRVWGSAGTSTTVASRAWLEDVDLWTRRVQEFARQHTDHAYPDSLRDNIYMDNLRTGIVNLRRRGEHLAAWRHVTSARYPWRAGLLSHLKLLYRLLFPVHS